MLDKIRKHHAGELREDFQSNLGKVFDAKCVNYLRVEYPALKLRVFEGFVCNTKDRLEHQGDLCAN